MYLLRYPDDKDNITVKLFPKSELKELIKKHIRLEREKSKLCDMRLCGAYYGNLKFRRMTSEDEAEGVIDILKYSCSTTSNINDLIELNTRVITRSLVEDTKLYTEFDKIYDFRAILIDKATYQQYFMILPGTSDVYEFVSFSFDNVRTFVPSSQIERLNSYGNKKKELDLGYCSLDDFIENTRAIFKAPEIKRSPFLEVKSVPYQKGLNIRSWGADLVGKAPVGLSAFTIKGMEYCSDEDRKLPDVTVDAILRKYICT